MNRVVSSRKIYARLLTAGAFVCLSLSTPGCGVGGSISAGPSSAAARAEISPTIVDFGQVEVGSKGSAKITITNSGLDPLNVSAVTVSGQGFNTTGLSPPLEIPAGQSSSFEVNFSPQGAGSAAGSLSVAENASTVPLETSLSGVGITRRLTASLATVRFGDVGTGEQKIESVTLTSTGTASVEITQAKVLGAGFSIRELGLPFTLAHGQSATFSVVYSPTTTGNSTGSISIVSTASNSPTSLSLSGTAVTQQLSLSSGSLSFGNVVVGSSSDQTILVRNTGTANLTINQATVTGNGFSISGLSLPFNLASGANTSFDAVFAPLGTGTASGSIALVSTATNSPSDISLSCLGSA